MFSKKKYDTNLIVIGAGSAGLISANIAATIKAKVTLIEKHKMGGDCLNTGCVPSKSLLRSAKINHYIKRADEFGLQVGSSTVDFAKVMGRVQGIIKHIEPVDSVERYTELGADCIKGEAKLISAHVVEVNGQRISAPNIIIATGARPFVPAIPGLDSVPYLTSDNLWQLEHQPESLLVLGAGPIACEMAQAFSRLGTKVSLVQRSDRILSREEPEASAYVEQVFTDEGIEVFCNSGLAAIEKNDAGISAQLNLNGEKQTRQFSHVLVAYGRQANTENLGLESLGIKLRANGTIAVDQYLRTSQKHIFACGDVTGPYQFTHMASHQAWFASVNSLLGGFKKFKVDYSIVPKATFTDPEVASVGLLESELKQAGKKFETTFFKLDEMDRALAEGEAKGFIKIMTKAGSDKILGVTICGAHAGELITEFITAMKNGFGLNQILATIHIYPSYSEANKYLAGQWKRKRAPQWALKILEKVHRFNRR